MRDPRGAGGGGALRKGIERVHAPAVDDVLNRGARIATLKGCAEREALIDEHAKEPPVSRSSVAALRRHLGSDEGGRAAKCLLARVLRGRGPQSGMQARTRATRRSNRGAAEALAYSAGRVPVGWCRRA